MLTLIRGVAPSKCWIGFFLDRPTLDLARDFATVRLHFGQGMICMKIYVGNMSFETTEERLQSLFEKHGTVQSARVAKDRETGNPRGFGFVEMEDLAQANAAMTALNGTSVDGRNLNIKESRPREDRVAPVTTAT